ncbi:MAG TPA: MarR family winged helix-turn-helix transcriptional regulator [Terriglobales bacterium]|nr:MarR family winged helix-turn-helix transcriptional regulator [Terriglobales bacterium]
MTRYTESGGSWLSESEYRALAAFRYHIRRFMRFSEEAAREAGLETQQYQLLLAVKAEPGAPSMGDIAERMQIQHHSAVELVNRCANNGLVRRVPDESDRRKVMLELTPKGERILRQLARPHRAALSTMAPMLVQALQQISRDMGNSGSKKPRASRNAAAIATTNERPQT